MLADLPIDAIDADALEMALADALSEGLRLEFKRTIAATDAAKDKWALTVSSFANASGGVVLIGAEEEQGVLTGLPGLDEDPDALILRLEQTARTRLDPTLPGLNMKSIQLDHGKPIVVARIDRSWRGPHLLRRPGTSSWQLARRSSAGRYQVEDVTELRVAFLEATGAADAARVWHDDQVAAVRAGDTPLPFEHDGPLLVVTVRPLGATATSAPVLNVAAALQDLRSVLVPLNWTSHGLRAFIDGVYTGDSGSGDRSPSAAWVLRNGSVVIADAYCVAGSKAHREERGVPTSVFRDSMVKAMQIGPATSLAVGAALPLLVQATVLGIDGFTFRSSNDPNCGTRRRSRAIT